MGYYRTNAIPIDEISKRWVEGGDKIYDDSMPLMYSVNDLWKHREYSWTRESSRNGLARVKGQTVQLSGPLKWDAIKADLQANGWDSDEPLYLEVGKNGKVKVGEGNHRLAIAKEINLSKIPVWVQFRQSVEKAPPPPKLVELDNKATKKLVKEAPKKKLSPEEQETINDIMDILGLGRQGSVNPYLNTPPTELKRNLKSVKDKRRRKQMQGGGDQKYINHEQKRKGGEMNKEKIAVELLKLAKSLVAGKSSPDKAGKDMKKALDELQGVALVVDNHRTQEHYDTAFAIERLDAAIGYMRIVKNNLLQESEDDDRLDMALEEVVYWINRRVK
jgi:hypothetical protein